MKEKVNYKNKKGITLIALIITIIILIILAAISINLLFGENGIIGKAKESKFKSKMSQIAEDFDLYMNSMNVNTLGELNQKEIYAGGELIRNIIADEELEVEEEKIEDIRQMLEKVGKEEEAYVIVFEGELYYVSQKSIKNNENQTKWCEEIGIKIWDYVGNTGIKVVNGNYENINGMYMCTPKLNTGFVKEKTRYIKEKDGNLTPGNWINKKPDDDWYDYKKQRWANLYVESNGIESYYVWIPRYVYKEVEGERIDAKFVDINNNYTDGETEETTSWETLQSQGYKVPEAFYYGDSDNYLENKAIPGYWVSKYQLSELVDSDTYSVDFSTTATPTSITIKNIITSTDKAIAKYQYAINGKIVHESTTPEDYKLEGLAKGNKAVNVTILDSNGNIIGSMTKLYEVADVNEPDLAGFDKDTTFYVYWDENGIEHNEIPISQKAPDEWYDYGIRNWANIVTRNNGLETYLVWIPRYSYAIDTVSQRTYVKFLKGTSTETDAGYRIPEAFTWGDSGEVQLTGYWVAKYQLTESGPQAMTAEFSAGSDKIRVMDITGTKITEGLKYEYYLNEKKVYEGTDPLENYTYKGLEANKIYTVNIIARNRETNEYVAATTKKIETVGANKPDLTGYNADMTYYVLYDNEGNMKIGDKIKNDGSNSPEDWYDYGARKWANIVVTDGRVENGQIVEATNTSYFVWIPRYQYTLDTVNQRTIIKFITGKGTETEAGYKIPEAFTWGDDGSVQLTGYWMSKYQLSN